MSSPDSTVELTAEQFARLDANRRQVGALTSRLHQAKTRAKVAEQIVADARALVATLPHGSPHDERLCLKCRMDKLLTPTKL